MIQRLKKHHISFKVAFQGLLWCVKTQPNFQVHLFLSLVTVFGIYYYNVSYIEALILVLLIVIGLVVEIVNTAFECTLDAVSTERRPDIKIAKDVAAASMLVLALGAFAVACIIFLPKIFV